MQLETERLILREWQESDIPDLIAGINNLKVSQWLSVVPFPYGEKEARDYFEIVGQEAQKSKEEKSAYDFAIELKSENKVIGGTGLNKINLFDGVSAGGIWLNENYHGQGFGLEAYERRTKFAFEDLGLRKVESGFVEGNFASFKMHSKLGFKLEGCQRKPCRCLADGQIKDVYLMGLLKEEFVELK